MLALANSYSVIDSHTAGHPTRVIFSGLPPMRGRTVAEQRDWFKDHCDHLRPRLLHEPAGHAATVGLVPVLSNVADFGAFFISSYTYLDMCGHATIGYAKTLAATGSIASPLSDFTLETPAGVVVVHLSWTAAEELASVRLHNVASYHGLAGLTVDLPGLGPVTADLAYGGIWYALVDAASIGLTLEPATVSRALLFGAAIKLAITDALQDMDVALGGGAHPSVLFYSDIDRLRARHLVVLDSNKFDRSPCGTGTSARLALLAHRGTVTDGETYTAESLLGTTFSARIASRTMVRGRDAIIPEIEGAAYITAFSSIVKEAADPLSGGFLCR